MTRFHSLHRTHSLPMLDSTAYPHILEQIISECHSVNTLLALRATSRQCQDLADARLFHHAVLQREWYTYTAKPKSRLDKLRQRISGPVQRESQRFYLSLPDSSTIAEQRRRLPLLAHKVGILDLYAERVIDVARDPSYEFIDRIKYPGKCEDLRRVGRGVFSDYAPRVLRRFGFATKEFWGQVLDTTVDFLRPDATSWLNDVSVPMVTPRYVLHLHWPEEYLQDPPETPFSFLATMAGSPLVPEVRAVIFVLSPHCTPPPPKDILRIIQRATVVFMWGMTNGNTSFTVVGLERWLPGVEANEFKRSSRAAAVLQYTFNFDIPEEDTGRAFDNIHYLTLEEWWESLGDMKEVIGVWPGHE